MSQALRLATAMARRFEGVRLKPYLCPAVVPTIGIGSTFYLDGRPVKLTDPAISEETAEHLLQAKLRRIYAPAAIRQVPTADTFARTAALIDFCLNLGPTRLKASTLRRKALAGDWEGAAAEALRWNRAGGRILPGLVLRCQARAAMLKADA
ncbi:COG3772 Phage-related lysozyme (muraminidase) [uncultured Caudovirales phage]|uniref:Lysozyme n=1 Tax=uncultured Caudovirales phage TaxID=2100421 RepID=A0A6J5NHZ0_9CAUD|nr:COG3772 Phage-related lysozyme (muraminidase) [uncultured Caudovirales phage]